MWCSNHRSANSDSTILSFHRLCIKQSRDVQSLSDNYIITRCGEYQYQSFKMKTIFCLLALAVIVQSAVLVDKNAIARNNINIGGLYPGDRLLSRQYVYRPAVANAIQTEDFAFRGNATSRISSIQVTEQGYTQWASTWVIQGGIGYPNVTIRFQSYRGYGYYYLIDIWGR